MVARRADREAEREARRRLVRKARLYTYGFLLAAVAVAVAGSAVVAWLLTHAGLPFLTTWLAVTVVVLLIPAVGALVRAVRRGRGVEPE